MESSVLSSVPLLFPPQPLITLPARMETVETRQHTKLLHSNYPLHTAITWPLLRAKETHIIVLSALSRTKLSLSLEGRSGLFR